MKVYCIPCQKIDIILTSTTVTPQRAEVVDFTASYWSETGGFFINLPRQFHQDYFYIFEPLSAYVWAVTISTVIIVGLTLFTMSQEKVVEVPAWLLESVSLMFGKGNSCTVIAIK